jgi:hypothetical protein
MIRCRKREQESENAAPANSESTNHASKKESLSRPMEDDTIDASMTELEQLLKEEGMSLSTKKVFNVIHCRRLRGFDHT